MALKKFNLLIFSIIIFWLTFGFSFLIVEDSKIKPSVPVALLEEMNRLAEEVNESLEKREGIKNAEIQKLIDEGRYGDFHLLNRVWKVKLYKTGQVRPKTNNAFFNWVGKTEGRPTEGRPTEFSLAVPVGKNEVKGTIIVTHQISSFEKSSGLIVQILFSLAITFLLLAWIHWIKAKTLIRPIDRLCQQFTRYRRENENTDIILPQNREKQNTLERRVDILEDLWDRFQATQRQLADKVDELRQSEKEKETTIQELERAKVQEKRLVELGYALAEFGHDIGNANGAVLSFVTLLLKTLEKKTVDAMDLVKSLTFIRRIKIASTTVNGLTSDILEFAKGKTDLKLAEHPLEEFVVQLKVHLGFVSDIPLEFKIPEKEEINLKFDGIKITRVIVNLVKNAWEKLEEDSGEIHVEFLPNENDGITISITDNGNPIPSNILENMFKPFQTEGKAEGTGLGLAICQKIVEAHGGKIGAENLSDKAGVRFSFFLPNCVVSSTEGRPAEGRPAGWPSAGRPSALRERPNPQDTNLR